MLDPGIEKDIKNKEIQIKSGLWLNSNMPVLISEFLTSESLL